MSSYAYIGRLNSRSHGGGPEKICLCGRSFYQDGGLWRDIYNAVNANRPNTQQWDWGCWVWQMSKAEMVEFLIQEKYKDYTENALNMLKNLPDTEDYSLVAFDDG